MSKITFPGGAAGGGGGSGVTDHDELSGLGDDDHTQYLLRADFASSGAAQKPTTSGTVVGAGTDLYVSGISVGDYLSPHRTDSEINSLADARAQVFVEGGTANPASGVNIGAATQMWISGIPVGDNLGQGGGAADLSAVAEDILVVTSGAHSIGSYTKVWASGFFDGIVLADTDASGTYWEITVDATGSLTTTQVTA